MSASLKNSSRSLATLGPALRRIESRMAELGLNVLVREADAAVARPCHAVSSAQAGKPVPQSLFCQIVCGSPNSPCAAGLEALAAQALESGQNACGRSAIGCSLMAVPVRLRRKTAGVIAACFPTTDLLDEETLSRACDRLHIDRQVAHRLAADACRHRGEETADFMRILEWLLQDCQALGVADDELTTLSTNLANTYEELALVYNISGSVRVTAGAQEFLQKVCSEMCEVMKIETAAAVISPAPGKGAMQEAAVVHGFWGPRTDDVGQLLLQSVAPSFTANHRPVIANIWDSARNVAGLSVHNLVAVPLVVDQNVVGVLAAVNKLSGDFDSIDMKLISAVGSQASVFLDNNRLYADVQDLLMGVLHALTASIDAKDPYTCGHSLRVAKLSRQLALACGYPRDKAERLYLCGLLHDIGKIGVPERILCKTARLTDEEYDVIKRHPGIGAKILTGIRQLEDVAVGIVTHHERLDGRGYPNALKGEEIPMDGRIVGLADAFDALTSDRVYRKALSPEQVIAEIRRCTGTQFDPLVVEKLLAWDIQTLLAEMPHAEADGLLHRNAEECHEN
ncbi:MAG: HD domain-containing protein [Planctomycetaceae bacterium]|nr:HD domain-containing protein [Planctomycetaceae bacterium]